MEIPKEFWQLCLENTHTSLFCIRQCLIQFKRVLKLQTSKNVSNCECSMCKTPIRFQPHQGICFGGALGYTNSQECVGLSYTCNRTISPSAHISTFGIPAQAVMVSSPQLKAIAFASVTAQRFILLHWKLDKPPSFNNSVK